MSEQFRQSPDSTRRAVINELLAGLRTVRTGQRALVAIDGVDGAGKSVLASELAERAESDGGRPLFTVGIDGFHVSRARRYARGRGPESFYRDSYDYPAFIRNVVDPFIAQQPITPAVWDVDADVPVASPPVGLPSDCVLLVDGIFLHRPELRNFWDASIWVDVPFEVSVPRGNRRFGPRLDDDPEAPSNHRYVGGQRLYFDECRPWTHATWILDNTEIDHPRVVPPGSWHY